MTSKTSVSKHRVGKFSLVLKTSMIQVLLITFGMGHSASGIAGCDPVAAKKGHPGYVIGFGEGASYEQTKLNALADALQIFGVQISSRVTVTQTLQDVDLVEQNQTVAQHESKGAEVLEFCGGEGSSKMVIGIKKFMLKTLLLDQANLRVKAAASGGFTKREISLSKDAESRDRKHWLVLGFAISEFPVAIFQLPEKSKGPFVVKTGDDIAQQTLPLLLARLKELSKMEGVNGMHTY